MRVVLHLLWLFTFALATPASADVLAKTARRGWMAAAELAHTASSGSCQAIDEAEALRVLAADRNCDTSPRQASFEDIAALGKSLDQTSEDAFFKSLAKRHADEMNCGADFADQVARDEHGALEDISNKLRAAREARQAWTKAVKDLHANRGADQMCPSTLNELDRSAYGNSKRNTICERQIKAHAAFAMAQSSIPLIGEPSLADFVKGYVNRSEDLPAPQLASELAKAYASAGTGLRTQGKTLKAQKDFGLEERRNLLSDPLITKQVVALNPGVLGAVECRADARFGAGAEARDKILLAGTLALSTLALPLEGVGLATSFIRGAQAAQAAGQLSLSASRVLGVGAAFGALGAGATDAAKSCFGLPVKVSGACASAPKVERLKSESCALATSLAGLDAAGVVPGAALAKFFSLGFGTKKAAGAAEALGALKKSETVGFRTESGKARVGEVLEVRKGADGKVESAVVEWIDAETGVSKRKLVPVDQLDRKPTALATLPLKNDAATDTFRRAFNDDLFTAENRFVAYNDPVVGRRAARVVGRRGDGLEVEVLTGSKVERRTLTPAEIESVRLSSTAASPEFFSAYNHQVFGKQPAYGVDVNRSINQRVYVDSSGPRTVQVTNDHSYRRSAIAHGDIVEHHTAGRLPPGEYTYGVLEDGTIVTGRVYDNFEFGVKHSHLADGRRLLVAGEVKVPEKGDFGYNIESGTYTRALIEKLGLSADELTEKAGRSLSMMMGSEGIPTTRTFWSNRSPDVRAVRSYCQDRAFYELNLNVCRGLSH